MFFVKKYLFIFLFLGTLQVQAQYYEFGLFGGGANYFGDLNAVTQFRPGFPAVGAFFRYNMNPYMTHRFSVFYGKVSFDDCDLFTSSLGCTDDFPRRLNLLVLFW